MALCIPVLAVPYMPLCCTNKGNYYSTKSTNSAVAPCEGGATHPCTLSPRSRCPPLRYPLCHRLPVPTPTLCGTPKNLGSSRASLESINCEKAHGSQGLRCYCSTEPEHGTTMQVGTGTGYYPDASQTY